MWNGTLNTIFRIGAQCNDNDVAKSAIAHEQYDTIVCFYTTMDWKKMGDWLVGLCRPLAGWKLEISVEGYTIWPPISRGELEIHGA